MKRPICLIEDDEVVQHYYNQIERIKKQALKKIEEIEEDANKKIKKEWNDLEKSLITKVNSKISNIEDFTLEFDDGVLFVLEGDSQEEEKDFLKKIILNITK
jgi:hypothetical protein